MSSQAAKSSMRKGSLERCFNNLQPDAVSSGHFFPGQADLVTWRIPCDAEVLPYKREAFLRSLMVKKCEESCCFSGEQTRHEQRIWERPKFGSIPCGIANNFRHPPSPSPLSTFTRTTVSRWGWPKQTRVGLQWQTSIQSWQSWQGTIRNAAPVGILSGMWPARMLKFSFPRSTHIIWLFSAVIRSCVPFEQTFQKLLGGFRWFQGMIQVSSGWFFSVLVQLVQPPGTARPSRGCSLAQIRSVARLCRIQSPAPAWQSWMTKLWVWGSINLGHWMDSFLRFGCHFLFSHILGC